MTDCYMVVGNPIAQSRSPQIHRLFAEQTGEDIAYASKLVEQGGFEEAADEFFASGGKGMNITMPFKQDAYTYARRLSPAARVAGAVNTLALEADGQIVGHNTDGVGLVTDLIRQGQPIAAQRVLILGAGGAVRGVLEPLLKLAPERLVISNRTFEKAQQLAKGFAGYGAIHASSLGELSGDQFDLVINGTSASLGSAALELPASILAAGSFAYDMVYAAKATGFMRWAESLGSTTSDGLGMLVGQAAESFRLWRGVSVDIVKVIATLRADMLNNKA